MKSFFCIVFLLLDKLVWSIFTIRRKWRLWTKEEALWGGVDRGRVEKSHTPEKAQDGNSLKADRWMILHWADGTLLLGYIWKKAKVYPPHQHLPYQPPGVTKKMLEINISKTIFKKESFFQILKELIQLPLNSPRKSFTINKCTLIDIKQAKSPLTSKILECLFDTWVSHKEFSTKEICTLLQTLYTAAEKYVETNSVSNYEIIEEFQTYLCRPRWRGIHSVFLKLHVKRLHPQET